MLFLSRVEWSAPSGHFMHSCFAHFNNCAAAAAHVRFFWSVKCKALDKYVCVNTLTAGSLSTKSSAMVVVFVVLWLCVCVDWLVDRWGADLFENSPFVGGATKRFWRCASEFFSQTRLAFFFF